MSMSTLGPTGEAVGDLPMVGERVTMTLANPDRDAVTAAASIEEGRTVATATAAGVPGADVSSIHIYQDSASMSAAADGTTSSVTASSIATMTGAGTAGLESPGPGGKIITRGGGGGDGRRRRPWMIVAAILLVLVTLGLIIGLSVGLSRVTEPRPSRATDAAATPGTDNTPFESTSTTTNTATETEPTETNTNTATGTETGTITATNTGTNTERIRAPTRIRKPM